jgi:purine-binding chemotaxis protein CheW
MNEVMGQRRREILVFEIGGRRFGLPANEVRELLRAVTIVGLPLAPSFVEGIINLRGTVVPVLDIRARLRLPAKAPEPADYLLVVGMGERPVALRIDRALELKTIDAADVESAGGVRSGERDVAEVVKLPEGLMLMLNLRDLASPDELAAIPEVPEACACSGESGERS